MITEAVVLAGGEGHRMGGVDKGLLAFAGRTLVETVIERVALQVDALAINANRHQDRYRAFGYPVFPDQQPGHGPLGGIETALARACAPRLLIVPCDTPFLPEDLVARLDAALSGAARPAAVAHDGCRLHPTIALYDTRRKAELMAQLANIQRGVLMRWLERVGFAMADFRDLPEAFTNINSERERRRAEAMRTGSEL